MNQQSLVCIGNNSNQKIIHPTGIFCCPYFKNVAISYTSHLTCILYSTGNFTFPFHYSLYTHTRITHPFSKQPSMTCTHTHTPLHLIRISYTNIIPIHLHMLSNTYLHLFSLSLSATQTYLKNIYLHFIVLDKIHLHLL